MLLTEDVKLLIMMLFIVAISAEATLTLGSTYGGIVELVEFVLEFVVGALELVEVELVELVLEMLELVLELLVELMLELVVAFVLGLVELIMVLLTAMSD
jgi:hypothetical protein